MANSIIERLKKEPTPLIDHDQVTFVWKGKTAPDLVGDFSGWEDGRPFKLEKQGKGVWTYQLNLPGDAYIEYGFVRGDGSLDDPFNPRKTSNGVGGYNNYFSMPEYTPTNLIGNDRSIAHGTVKRYRLPTDYLISGENRTVTLYQPPASGPVPLLAVWDGQDYLHRGRLNLIVDNLIAQKRIQPIAMAFIYNGGQRSRTSEYSCNEATLLFLMKEVLPLAQAELNLINLHSHPGEFGILGASSGGLMALYTSARLPHIFGRLFSQSGAFSYGSLDTVVFDLFGQGVKRPIKIWMDVGIYDLPGLLESNRRMQQLLIQRGYPVVYHEYNAGHNYPAWRDDIWRGLEALYGLSK
jgi:enterochelin esterase-like enzyme